MADNWQNRSQTGSAVLDMNIDEMEIMDDAHSDVSDYEHSFTDEKLQSRKEGKTMVDDIKQKMGENVTQMVWQAGAQSAKRAWSLYGNIDILRPYFDVEPQEVRSRLLYSLIPVRQTDKRQQVSKELYGPTMVVLTLIALLLYQMKTADHKVEEGTLMGTAFGMCFMYWLGVSSIVWFVSYVCNVRITILQILSMIGYGLFGHCIVLFLGTVLHTSHDHMLFYILWAVIGGLSTLKMAGIIMSRARGRTERLVVITVIAVFHLLFLLYLHFAYHTIVEEISDALNENIVPLPAQQFVQQEKDIRVNDNEASVIPKDNQLVNENGAQALQEGIDTVTNAVKQLIDSSLLKDNQPLVNAVVNDTLKIHEPVDLIQDNDAKQSLLAKMGNSKTIIA